MPRSNRPRRGGRPLRRATAARTGADTGARPGADEDADPGAFVGLGGMQRSETHPDGEWVVRRVTGASAAKAYTCPGCLQLIARGTPHVVAWPAADLLGPESALGRRRHWHPSCWESRFRRRPR